MEANAPERIYVCDNVFPNHVDWEGSPINTKRIDGSDIEYVRTDAFIEKALFWLKNHYRDYMHNPTGKRLEAFFGIDMCNDFENYMKGE